MLKALIRKQLQEIGYTYLNSRKKKNKIRKSGTGMIVLLCFCAVIFLGLFFMLSKRIGMIMIPMDLDWLYFVFMGIIALIIGMFGSVFSTYASLFKAKDNEMLLSLPISPSKILFSRIFSVFFFSFIYEALVFIPAMAAYWTERKQTVWMVVSQVISLIVMAFLVLVLSSLLGWVVAKVSSYIRNKTVGTVVLSIVFIGVYYVVYFKFNDILNSILSNVDEIRTMVHGSIYPAFAMGMGTIGHPIELLIFTAIVMAAFAIVYIVMSKSFTGIVTKTTGIKKVEYNSSAIKTKSVKKTLLNRELKHLEHSSTYLLNCGIGLLILLALAVFALIKSDALQGMLYALTDLSKIFTIDLVAVMVGAIMILILGMGTFTAPSVSLEGKSIWIVRSLPVETKEVLDAKVRMHVLIEGVFAITCGILIGIGFRFSVLQIVAMILVVLSFIWVLAESGLCFNLKKNNLDWVSEAIPVKQSMAVILAILVGFAGGAVTAGLYFLVRKVMSGELYMVLLAVVFAAVAWLLGRWNRTKGARIFDNL